MPMTFKPSTNLAENRQRQNDLARRIFDLAVKMDPSVDSEGVELIREERRMLSEGQGEA